MRRASATQAYSLTPRNPDPPVPSLGIASTEGHRPTSDTRVGSLPGLHCEEMMLSGHHGNKSRPDLCLWGRGGGAEDCMPPPHLLEGHTLAHLF